MPTGTPAARSSRDRGQAGADHLVRARAVGHPGAPAGQLLDLVRVRVHAVGDPRAVGAPADVLEVLDRAAAVRRRGSRCPRRRPRPGGCAGARRAARPARRSPSSARASPRTASTGPARPGSWRRARAGGARPTSRSDSARIVSSSCTTESGGRPPSFCERLIEPRVAWKRMPSSCAAVISARDQVAAAGGVHVEVVHRRGAAAERQLGQADPRREVGGLLVEPGPDRVERRQPAEQVRRRRRAVGPGEVLVDVVMGVDQARRDQAAVGPHRADGCRLGPGRPDAADQRRR